MGYKILAINPGSTSTKIALFDAGELLFNETLRHSSDEIAKYNRVADQLDWRRGLVMNAIAKNNFDIHDLSAVIGRGGLIKPIESGIYEVNDALRHDLVNAQMEHASNLGGLIAEQIAKEVGVKAFIADPVVVDEMDPIARISGLPQTPRYSIFHALNQKATARLYCKEKGVDYQQSNIVVAHLGGGISVSAHKQGRVVDTNNALDGDGPFTPERAGSVPAGELVGMCFSGKYTEMEIRKMLSGKGGLTAHLGVNSVLDILDQIKNGDKVAELILEAMCYTTAKNIGAMATVLEGEVDAIILTGGIAHNSYITDMISKRCSFISPVAIYPGENELEALEMNARLYLEGEITAKVYK